MEWRNAKGILINDVKLISWLFKVYGKRKDQSGNWSFQEKVFRFFWGLTKLYSEVIKSEIDR